VYGCNGSNPPSADVYAGSVLPRDNFMEDAVAFRSAPGAHITATVDTVSAATAFDIEACISGTPQGDCLPGFSGDDNFSCTFPPPSFACPRFGGLLPADPDNDNIYYLRINSGSGASNFAARGRVSRHHVDHERADRRMPPGAHPRQRRQLVPGRWLRRRVRRYRAPAADGHGQRGGPAHPDPGAAVEPYRAGMWAGVLAADVQVREDVPGRLHPSPYMV
jgi:hypothetical protein